MRHNTCGYSDEWQPYTDYDKYEYDVMDVDGNILTNCYPNARKFNSAKTEEQWPESRVAMIRFSEFPIMMLNGLVSERPCCFESHGDGIVVVDDEDEEPQPKSRMESGDYTLTNPYNFDYVADVTSHRIPKKWRNAKVVDVRTTPKVGRNEPCPCGSGKKNKSCCKMNALPK